MAAKNDKFDYIKNYIASTQMAKDLLDKIEKKKGNKKHATTASGVKIAQNSKLTN